MRRSQSEEQLNQFLKSPGRKLSGAVGGGAVNRPRHNSFAESEESKKLASHGSSSQQAAVPAPPTRRTSFQKGESNVAPIPGSPQRTARRDLPPPSPQRPIRKISFPLVESSRPPHPLSLGVSHDDVEKKVEVSTSWRLLGIFLFAVGLVAFLALSLGYGERSLRMGRNADFAQHHRLLSDAGVTKYELLPNFSQEQHVRRVLDAVGEATIEFKLRVLDEDFSLSLNRHDDLFAPNYETARIFSNGRTIVDTQKPSCVYTATIVGDPHSVGSVSFCTGQLQLVMFHRTDRRLAFTVAPIDNKMHVAFRHLSTPDGKPNKQLSCGSNDDHLRELRAAFPLKLDERSLAETWSATGARNKTVQYSIVNDVARFTSLGEATEQDTVSIVSTIRVFYSLLYSKRMYGVDIVLYKQVTFVDVDGWSTPSDESNLVDSQGLLNDFAAWKLAQSVFEDSDLVHMYSGREFAGGYVGRAGQAGLTEKGICQPNNCGVIQTSGFDLGLYAKIATHEMAHGLSLSHDDLYSNPACRSNSNTFIWSSISLQDGTYWTTCSIKALRDFLDGKVGPYTYLGCLENDPRSSSSSAESKNATESPTGVVADSSKTATSTPTLDKVSRDTATKYPTSSGQSRKRTEFPSKSPRHPKN
jgi:hypothetical protein